MEARSVSFLNHRFGSGPTFGNHFSRISMARSASPSRAYVQAALYWTLPSSGSMISARDPVFGAIDLTESGERSGAQLRRARAFRMQRQRQLGLFYSDAGIFVRFLRAAESHINILKM